jgi:hypothetical protein
VSRVGDGGIRLQDPPGQIAGRAHEVDVLLDAGQLEVRQPGLGTAEQLAGTPDPQVRLGQDEAIGRGGDRGGRGGDRGGRGGDRGGRDSY